ncbi:hypothetical protein HDU99_010800, partial [Rhizoclosmatium hyalinum]
MTHTGNWFYKPCPQGQTCAVVVQSNPARGILGKIECQFGGSSAGSNYGGNVVVAQSPTPTPVVVAQLPVTTQAAPVVITTTEILMVTTQAAPLSPAVVV